MPVKCQRCISRQYNRLTWQPFSTICSTDARSVQEVFEKAGLRGLIVSAESSSLPFPHWPSWKVTGHIYSVLAHEGAAPQRSRKAPNSSQEHSDLVSIRVPNSCEQPVRQRQLSGILGPGGGRITSYIYNFSTYSLVWWVIEV